MNAARTPLGLRAAQLTSRHLGLLPLPARRRRYATEPASRQESESESPAPHPPSSPPNPTANANSRPKEPSRVGTFYRTFSYPILKAFLGALFTYQLTYYFWFKLQVAEEKHNKRTEIHSLRAELKDAVVEQRERAGGVVEKVRGKAEEAVGQVKGKKGWWGW